ncbi:MAG TPA: transketolase [Beijerinckia sp.]|jgi:transketolase|nr:transketolase [Beijerinckia sp.]
MPHDPIAIPEIERAGDPAHTEMANAIRALAMDAVEKAKSGHPGLPMGAADIATVLFTKILKFDAADPAWPDRDRFILSAGHGSMLLYALLYLTGEKSIDIEQLKAFRQFGSLTPGHPEAHHTPGVEMTTGPLGQGLATSVGFALAERMLNAEFGAIVDHHTYVLASDGDLMEGISQEAIAIAGHLQLNRLIVLFDDNGISIDGPISIADSVDQVKRFEACGWNAERIDGHDPQAIHDAILRAQVSGKPSLIACKTTIGFGAPTRAGTAKAHGEALGQEEVAGARKNLGWSHEPFAVPEAILAKWREAGRRNAQKREAWTEALAKLSPDLRGEFERRLRGDLPASYLEVALAYKRKLAEDRSEVATRKASQNVLEVLAAAVPELVTGSADLTGSNNTKVAATAAIAPGHYAGRYIHWGIREHGMAAAVNGMALHGGYIPSGATFLVFSDYCRPSLRLAALMGVRSIEVFTHDSIGLGEDGPTHQPVEHLAALRAIPNLNLFRPADQTETLECWQLAIEAKTSPSVLALTRQNLPAVRHQFDPTNLCATGAYELAPAAGGKPEVSIFASGSEVPIALAARDILAARQIPARVVSVPSLDLFLAQSAETRRAIIGESPIRIAVEAAIRQGWDEIIGADGIFIGMKGFGASAPYKKLYEYFGITADAVADAVMQSK